MSPRPAATRMGIVGAGGIGRIHAENLTAIDGARVTAVMDVAADPAEELAAACGARAFTELAPMLDEVDAVYVCSPPTFHREHVVAAVSACKHVFCEKRGTTITPSSSATTRSPDRT